MDLRRENCAVAHNGEWHVCFALTGAEFGVATVEADRMIWVMADDPDSWLCVCGAETRWVALGNPNLM